jgi:hypothetical protein
MKITGTYKSNGLFVTRFSVKPQTRLVKKVLSNGSVLTMRVKVGEKTN